MSTKEKKEELQKKLHDKLLSKKLGRLNKDQRQKKVDDMCQKMGMSQADIKGLAELSKTITKTKQK
jgi:hypothetical protein